MSSHTHTSRATAKIMSELHNFGSGFLGYSMQYLSKNIGSFHCADFDIFKFVGIAKLDKFAIFFRDTFLFIVFFKFL